MIRLVSPWPPSVNTMFYQGKNHGQKFKSKKAKQYSADMETLYKDESRVALTGHQEVTLYLIPPDSRTRDGDNYVKAPLDALTQLGFVSDDSIVKIHHIVMCEKNTKYNKGMVIIELEPMINRQYISTSYLETLISNTDTSYFIKTSKAYERRMRRKEYTDILMGKD